MRRSCTMRKNTMEAGLDGVVCSPLEAGKVHAVCGEKVFDDHRACVLRTAMGRSEACDDTCKGKGTRIGLHRSRKTDHTGGSGSGIPQMCGRICRLGRHTRRGDGRNSLVSSFFIGRKGRWGKMPQKRIERKHIEVDRDHYDADRPYRSGGHCQTADCRTGE